MDRSGFKAANSTKDKEALLALMGALKTELAFFLSYVLILWGLSLVLDTVTHHLPLHFCLCCLGL